MTTETPSSREQGMQALREGDVDRAIDHLTRAVITDGNDKGQTIEFVRDQSGKVNWVRVVGRVAVKQP